MYREVLRNIYLYNTSGIIELYLIWLEFLSWEDETQGPCRFRKVQLKDDNLC